MFNLTVGVVGHLADDQVQQFRSPGYVWDVQQTPVALDSLTLFPLNECNEKVNSIIVIDKAIMK